MTNILEKTHDAHLLPTISPSSHALQAACACAPVRSQNLFTPNILSDLGWLPKASVTNSTSVYTRIFHTAWGNAVIVLMGEEATTIELHGRRLERSLKAL